MSDLISLAMLADGLCFEQACRLEAVAERGLFGQFSRYPVPIGIPAFAHRGCLRTLYGIAREC